jgi:protein-S-isoprenylcysteine O-methyltransferase Ste14
MNKEKTMEVATYIIVPLAMWVVSPLVGKFLDSFYFDFSEIITSSMPLIIVGATTLLCGTILAVWTIYLFKTVGQGTPNPKLPPKTFVVSGPYRYSRNPMALGGLLILLGEAAIYYSPSLLGIAMLYGVIIYFNAMFVEEPELKERFGVPYTDYLKQVPRFFPNPWKGSGKE